MHAWIRVFEALLNTGYKKVTKNPKSENFPAVIENKKIIQKRFLEHMNLRVDAMTLHGPTNNENTARKAFADPEMLGFCLGFTDEEIELIVMFRNILLAISSEHFLNVSNFKSYCYDTFQRWISLFEWSTMTATIHKILVHSADIAANFTLQ